MTNRRGSIELEWKELFGLLIGGILLVSVFSPLISYLDGILGVTSPTQKSFNSLCDEVDELISNPERIDHADHISFTLEEGRALFGFDASYTPTRAFVSRNVARYGMDSYIDSAAEVGAGKAVGNITLPDLCIPGKACLCLADTSDFIEERKLEWLDCRSFTANISVFGIPFYDEDIQDAKGERVPQLEEVKSLYQEISAWDPRNFGLIRQDKNIAFRERLEQKGYNKSWYDWYGYLYIPHTQYIEDRAVSSESGGVRSVSVEKLEAGDHTHLLFIPLYLNRTPKKDIQASQEVVSLRRELIENHQQRRENELRQRINASSDKLADDPSYHLALYNNCSRYREWFPRKVLPEECDDVILCKRSSDSLSDRSCRLQETPCVCDGEVCDESHEYCYTTGCNASGSETPCGFLENIWS